MEETFLQYFRVYMFVFVVCFFFNLVEGSKEEGGHSNFKKSFIYTVIILIQGGVLGSVRDYFQNQMKVNGSFS